MANDQRSVSGKRGPIQDGEMRRAITTALLIIAVLVPVHVFAESYLNRSGIAGGHLV